MDVLTFSLGLGLGLGLCYWQRYRLRSQLKPLLTSLPDTGALWPSLPLASLVRRELTYLREQSQQREGKLQTWQALLDLAPIGFLWVDGDNQLLWCNQQARTLLNLDRWQPGEVRLLLELVRSYELDRLVERTRTSQQSQNYQWQFYPSRRAIWRQDGRREFKEATDGNSLVLQASSYPLSQGEVGIFLENRQPLADLSHSRARAFSDLTHELRTPLTSISLLAEALLKRLPGPERQWAEQLLAEAKRLMNLVQDWLDLSQLQENPQGHLCYQSLELGELICSAWQRLEPLAQQKALTLAYDRGEPLVLEADSSRLLQVFLNLFDNSIQYSPPGSAIEVQVEKLAEAPTGVPSPQSFLLVHVIDSGPGFSESDLPHVFARLYRGDSSRCRPFPASGTPRSGSGLGLSIAREIVRAHGGFIKASNHPRTGGAWLRLWLPVLC